MFFLVCCCPMNSTTQGQCMATPICTGERYTLRPEQKNVVHTIKPPTVEQPTTGLRAPCRSVLSHKKNEKKGFEIQKLSLVNTPSNLSLLASFEGHRDSFHEFSLSRSAKYSSASTFAWAILPRSFSPLF